MYILNFLGLLLLLPEFISLYAHFNEPRNAHTLKYACSSGNPEHDSRIHRSVPNRKAGKASLRCGVSFKRNKKHSVLNF